MARLLAPIPIPKGIKVEKKDGTLLFSGPSGSQEVRINPEIVVEIVDNSIRLTSQGPLNILGTTRALIKNSITGVDKGFEKVLEIRGMGYRAQKTKAGIQILIGFTHPVDFIPPKGISFDIKTVPNPDDPKEQMTEVLIKGTDKQLVGEVAAKIRAIKPPDVYKGKGIRYKGEYVKKKAGKRAIATHT